MSGVYSSTELLAILRGVQYIARLPDGSLDVRFQYLDDDTLYSRKAFNPDSLMGELFALLDKHLETK